MACNLESASAPKNLQYGVETLHDNLPTFHTLRNRGIPVSSTCPLCDEVEETTSHLFLFCSFTRAVWHGTSLAVHTSDFRNCSVQIWIDKLLQIHKKLEPENLNYLQGIFTTLWSIWTHRNLVVHEGKHPNLLEVVLTSQSFISRYKEAFFSHVLQHKEPQFSLEGIQFLRSLGN